MSPETAFIELHTIPEAQGLRGDYSALLDTYGLIYVSDNLYWRVGTMNRVQGWILHISVIRTEVEALLHAILPLLVMRNIPFKIIKDDENAKNILSGDLGPSQVGKVVGMYPDTDEQAADLVKALLPLTRPFRGPAVLTDIPLGGNIHARYGGHNPILRQTAIGRIDRFIYDCGGQLIPDVHHIPFVMPAGIGWPFDGIRKLAAAPAQSILNGRYKSIATLKKDTKGDVIKALYFNRWLMVKWCVIKQGKANMLSDEQGRDVRDRLAWQQQLHRILEDIVPLPRIIDLFRVDNNDYLVMEYVKGTALYYRVNQLNFRGHPWNELPVRQQQMILDYIVQLLGIAEKMHQKGIVHRDITPVNFLVDKGGHLVLIDIELAYSTVQRKPYPPFQYGTHGFMSPEQMGVEIPTPKEDIYGLGATLIVLLTGLPPGTFKPTNSRLKEDLFFFVGDRKLVALLEACLSPDPAARPTVHALQVAIGAYNADLLQRIPEKSPASRNSQPDQASVLEVIDAAIRGLVTEPTAMVDGLWYSKAPSQDQITDAQKRDYSKSIGLYEGISGVLYFLARAQKAGYDITPCRPAYEKGWEYVRQSLREQANITSPGFYGGRAGVALALAHGMDAGLLPSDEANRHLLQQCLEVEAIGVNVATGIAGQGLVVLQARQYLSPEFLGEIGKKHLQLLSASRQKDGRWMTFQDAGGRKRSGMSFSYGNSGIIWYLLELAGVLRDKEALDMAACALSGAPAEAVTMARLLNRKGFRQVLVDSPTGDTLPGLVLVLLKAFDALQDPTFQRCAEKILLALPDTLVHENLTQDSGLAGLGELYLQAYQTLQNPQWLERAGRIADLVVHTAVEGQYGTYHWLNNNANYPTADFMVGSSGIIYFLICYQRLNELGYRLLE